MSIYGLALLAFCFLTGQLFGEYLGIYLGINSNVGGVGFAMLFLIIIHDKLSKKGYINAESDKGIEFWSSLYIPVIVAMSAIQNVKLAISSGLLAILAGIIPVVASFLLMPLLSKLLKTPSNHE